MRANKPTVYVVDDDAALCEALQLLLESAGLRVKTYHSAEALLAEYKPGAAGCLVLDVRMRGMSGLDLQARLGRDEAAPPVIILTGHGDIPMAVRAVKNGAVDFLEKPVNDEVLIERIQHAIALDARRRVQRARRAEIHGRLRSLTSRERQVMKLILAGKANKQIAVELGIADKTVESHRKRVLHKMGVRGAVELAQRLAAMGPGT